MPNTLGLAISYPYNEIEIDGTSYPYKEIEIDGYVYPYTDFGLAANNRFRVFLPDGRWVTGPDFAQLVDFIKDYPDLHEITKIIHLSEWLN